MSLILLILFAPTFIYGRNLIGLFIIFDSKHVSLLVIRAKIPTFKMNHYWEKEDIEKSKNGSVDLDDKSNFDIGSIDEKAYPK